MAGYASVDADIDAWIEKHRLVLFSSSGGEECRAAFLSSTDGDTFEIWVDLPQDGNVIVGVSWVDGPTEQPPVPERTWIVPTSAVRSALDRAIHEAIVKMAPSVRRFPSRPRQQ